MAKGRILITDCLLQYCMLEFDVTKIFDISASACVLVIQLSDKPIISDVCNVYDFDYPEKAKSQLGYINGRFYNNWDINKENFDGHCCFEWRQGVKHDCSKVMELTINNGVLHKNGR